MCMCVLGLVANVSPEKKTLHFSRESVIFKSAYEVISVIKPFISLCCLIVPFHGVINDIVEKWLVYQLVHPVKGSSDV